MLQSDSRAVVVVRSWSTRLLLVDEAVRKPRKQSGLDIVTAPVLLLAFTPIGIAGFPVNDSRRYPCQRIDTTSHSAS